ncbi:MAG: hypothetical protein AAGB48_10760 [Planctomycetota bacterium]
MTSRTRLAALAALLTACAGTAGCNLVAPVFFIVAGPDKIEAAYKLDDDRSVVVFVEDPRSSMPRRALRVALLEAAESELLKNDLAETVVSGQAAMRTADNDPTAGDMTITELGRSVGADIVVWVTIDEFVRADMTRSVEPAVSMRVRVIDAANNAFLFPTAGPAAASGQAVVVRDAARQGTVSSASVAQSAAELAIAAKAGTAVVQLFYTHPVTEHAAERGF